MTIPKYNGVREAAKITDMTCEEKSEISMAKTRQLLSEAQLLMRDIEEMMNWCASLDLSNQRHQRMNQQECRASIEEDGETLVIEGFRFESAASRQELKRLSSQAAAGGCQGDT